MCIFSIYTMGTAVHLQQLKHECILYNCYVRIHQFDIEVAFCCDTVSVNVLVCSGSIQLQHSRNFFQLTFVMSHE